MSYGGGYGGYGGGGYGGGGSGYGGGRGGFGGGYQDRHGGGYQDRRSYDRRDDRRSYERRDDHGSDSRKRSFDRPSRGGYGGGYDKRPRSEPYKGREGREEAPKLFINQKFNFWNLPAKARVLIFSNINQAIAGPDCLYNLCSIYGDVAKVRIFAHKPDCALVEFTSATFAHIARDHLDNVEVKGVKMVVSFSHYDRIKLPEEDGKPEDENIKEFSSEEYVKLRRYRTEEFKAVNMKKIVAPSNTLHVGTVPPEFSPNNLKDLFIESGLKVVDVVGIARKAIKRTKVTDNPTRMFCYVEFADVDEALLGLAQVANANGIKLTFTKDTIEKVRKGYAEKNLPLLEGDDVPPIASLVELVEVKKEAEVQDNTEGVENNKEAAEGQEKEGTTENEEGNVGASSTQEELAPGGSPRDQNMEETQE